MIQHARVAAAPPQEEPDTRGVLAKMVTTLFEHWRLSSNDQLSLLGLSTGNRPALARYRKGEPLANSRDLLERAGHLLAIHKNLRLLFPHDRDLAYAWMTTANQALGGKTPVELITEWGFAGLLQTRAYLDRARGV
ncbi:MAG: MbcA/ParS/Xre antitoxin family protein [Thiobacillus sp.]|nr:MbcA/ParS/Xre antitoxin family protein [Thiobacillus sp.]